MITMTGDDHYHLFFGGGDFFCNFSRHIALAVTGRLRMAGEVAGTRSCRHQKLQAHDVYLGCRHQKLQAHTVPGPASRKNWVSGHFSGVSESSRS